MPRPDRRPAPDNLPDCHDRIEELENTLRTTIKQRRTNSAWGSISANALQQAQGVLDDQRRDVRIEITAWLRGLGRGSRDPELLAAAIERDEDRAHADKLEAERGAEVSDLTKAKDGLQQRLREIRSDVDRQVTQLLAKRDETIAKLREELVSAQRRGSKARAELAALTLGE